MAERSSSDTVDGSLSLHRYIRYSMFPLAPLMGEKSSPRTEKPSSRANR